jgi:phytoene synthase
MQGSAAAVGAMMCCVMEASPTPRVLDAARSLGEAMQLTNFLRDVQEDAGRGRIYLPLEDLARFGVEEHELLLGVFSKRMAQLM